MLKEYSESVSILKDCFWKIADFPLRIRNAFRRRFAGMRLFSSGKGLSDSQVTFYEVAVKEILKSRKKLQRFRRIYDYREILEHVDFRLGKSYLEQIVSINPNFIRDIDNFRVNDSLGKPRTFKYGSLGKVSPTTLRYTAVAADIQRKFGSHQMRNIVEVGGGYGGQAAVLSKLNYFENYYIYDLPNVQKLIQTFLSSIGVPHVHFPHIDDSPQLKYDLFISNYAFSELPRELQMDYFQNVISRSSRGYMLMNSGRHNVTGRSEGKISLDELKQLIPNLEVSEEVPLTSPDNYLITWKP